MPSRPAHRPSTNPDLTSYDLLAPQLSGGKDSAVMMAVFMEAARSTGVSDRVVSYHSSLGVLEWPPVVFASVRYPGVSELAALQSSAFGVPPDRHVEVTRTMPGPDGTRLPHSLLTEIAAYGRFPRLGSPYCRKNAKESVVSSAWALIVRQLGRELGRLYPETEAREPSAEILRLTGVSGETARDVSLTVYEGETLGLTGLVGAGYDDKTGLAFGPTNDDGRNFSGNRIVRTPQFTSSLGLNQSFRVPGGRINVEAALTKNTPAVLKRFKKILVPELNGGQLSWLLRAKYLAPAEGLNKVQGRPFLVSEIEAVIEKTLK